MKKVLNKSEVKNSNQLYKKLFYIYTAVIVSVVAALTFYYISSTRSRYLENNLEYLEKMHAETVAYMEDCEDIADYLHGELYHSEMEMSDLLHYLTDKPEEYQKYRLDTYMDYQMHIYKGIDAFISDSFEAYNSLKRVTLVSYSKGDMTYFTGKQNVYHVLDGSSVLKRIELGNLAAPGEFSFLKEIRDPLSMQSIGAMIVTFDTERIKEIEKYYEKTEIIVYNDSRMRVFDSTEDIRVKALEEARRNGSMEKFLSAYVRETSVDDYQIIGYLSESKAVEIPKGRIWMIACVAMLSILAGEFGVSIYLRRLSDRLNHILDGMTQVMDGNLSVRLEAEQKGDELDVISMHFNEMCEKLNLHIQKSYLAEIEQKNAEMAALQSQINPHFLYNTLEAIRMKAICNGDREVGKMLYSMAVTFRSQIKEADIITMAQELHYCKKYLELFEYRHLNQFKSEVECPLEYMNVPIIKFVLQPIIENYFIHGIRKDATDNFIKIKVGKTEDVYEICVEDNGQGMSAEEIALKNEQLKENKMDKTKSIGISNVNRRIKAVYGEAYGVHIEPRENGGLKVILRFRPEKGEIDEESNDCRG